MFGQSSETFFNPSEESALIFETINSPATVEFLQNQSQLLTVFLKFAEKKLTKNQKIVLIFVRMHKNKVMTFNSLAEKIHRKLKMPISTAKYTIKSLRDLLLINTGTKGNPRAPVSFTQAGIIIADFLIKNKRREKNEHK